MNPAAKPALAFCAHDHSHCCGAMLAQAEALADTNGARLTPVRRRVLAILSEAHRAMGAYEVLERLAEDGYGKQPPVAYRALDFLVEQGLANRIQRLNAYAACLSAERDHAPVFLICRGCEQVAEADATALRGALQDLAAGSEFIPERITVELLGLCARCRAEGRA